MRIEGQTRGSRGERERAEGEVEGGRSAALTQAGTSGALPCPRGAPEIPVSRGARRRRLMSPFNFRQRELRGIQLARALIKGGSSSQTVRGPENRCGCLQKLFCEQELRPSFDKRRPGREDAIPDILRELSCMAATLQDHKSPRKGYAAVCSSWIVRQRGRLLSSGWGSRFWLRAPGQHRWCHGEAPIGPGPSKPFIPCF